MTKKSQASGLAVLALIAIMTTTAIAANMTLNTTNQTITGYITAHRSVVESATIEVWANTSLKLEKNNNTIIAQLKMDNGSVIPDQKIDFYLNEKYFTSQRTDSNGQVKIGLNSSTYNAKAIFEGNKSLFLNPSKYFLILNESLEENETIENITEVNITTNVTIKEVKLIQGKAEIGKPVKWKKIIEVKNPTKKEINSLSIEIELPKEAKNIVLNKDKKLEKIGSKVKWVEKKILPNNSFIYEIEYETPAPRKEEIETKNGKIIKVFSDLKDIHYKDVFVETYIDSSKILINGKENFAAFETPEFEINGGGKPKLIWINGTDKIFQNETDVTNDPFHSVEILDNKIIWKVPHLSEQTYLLTREPTNLTDMNVYVERGCCGKQRIIPNIEKTNDGYKIFINKRMFRPGIYKLVIESDEEKEEYWFTWGLISINTRKSIYKPGETAEILMVVLDKYGFLVEDADISLFIEAPNGAISYFSTNDGSITQIEKGVYHAFYETKKEGNYTLRAFVKGDDVESSIQSYFLVKENYEYDIIRNTPVTTDPRHGPFESKIKIISYTNSTTFDFKEYLPEEFEIKDIGEAELIESNGTKILIWKNIKNNSIVSYKAEPPHRWPYLYKLGPSEVTYGSKIFKEARPWLLAVDPEECSWEGEDVSWQAVGTTGQSVRNTFTWNVGTNCSEAGGPTSGKTCYIANITVNFYSSTSSNSDEDASFRILNVTGGSYYYPGSFTVLSGSSIGPLITCGNSNNAQFEPNSPITCSLSPSDGFNSTTYTVQVLGPLRGSTSVSHIDYKWCWTVINPVISNPNVTASGGGWDTTNDYAIGGWGEKFNFTAYVEDSDDEYIIVNVSIAKPPYSYYSYINGSNATNGTTVSYVNTFTCDNITIAAYKFRANDSDGNKYYTSPKYFEIEKDDINVDNVTPTWNMTVNRSQPFNFTTFFWDRDNNTPPHYLEYSPYSAFTSISKYGSNETYDTVYGPTNTSGYLMREMKNDSSRWCQDFFYVGQNYWKGGILSANCYKDNVTGSNTIYHAIPFWLMGDLSQSSYQSPDGSQNYTRGDSISLGVSIKDDCGETKTDSSSYGTEFRIEHRNYVNITVASLDTATWVPLSNAPYGWYNVTATAFSEGSAGGKYWNWTYKKTNAFFLASKIKLDNPSVTPNPGGWGESPFTFSVNVTNEDNTSTTIRLWMKNSTTDWYLENYTTCDHCNNFEYVYKKNFTKYNVDNQWYFKINATSTSTMTNTTTPINFIVEKDDIEVLEISGNNQIVNRSDSEPGSTIILMTRVNDTDIGTWATETPIPVAAITYDGSTFRDVSPDSNSSGFINYTFNPGCTGNNYYDVGLQKWRMGISQSDIAYKAMNSTNFNITILGSLINIIEQPTGGILYNQGDDIIIIGNVTDDCDNTIQGANVKFYLNTTSASYVCPDDVGVFTELGLGRYQCEINTSIYLLDGGIYNITIVSNKENYNNGSYTEVNAFSLKAIPRLKQADVTPRSEGWSRTFNFSVSVSDNLGDTVTVRLWEATVGQENWVQIGQEKQCTSCDNYVMWWTKSYTCDDIEAKKFKFNASDTEGNNYTTQLAEGDYVGDDNTFVIEKDNVWIEYVSGNETLAALDTPAKLILRVYDIDNQTYNLSPPAPVSFNVTKFGIGSNYYQWGIATTNETGYANFDFYPDPSFLSTKQNWRGYINTTNTPQCYKYNVSGVYNVTTRSNVPKIENESVDIITAGWGITRNFTVMVYDSNDSATVYLWRSTLPSGQPWYLMGQAEYTNNGSWQELSIPVNFNCDLIGTWYYKFNVTNTIGNKNSTTPSALDNFTLTKDVVLLDYIYGNNSIANRTGSQTDLLRIRATDVNGTLLGGFNLTFFVTTNGYVYDDGFNVTTDNSGIANYYFEPTCNPRYEVGVQKWKAIVPTQECYADNDTDTIGYNLRLKVWGDFNNTIIEPTSLNRTEGDNIFFQVRIKDDCQVDFSGVDTVEFNASGPVNYAACTGEEIGGGIYQCYWDSTDAREGWYNATVFTNESFYYPDVTVKTNSSQKGLFYLFVYTALEDPRVTPPTEGWTQLYNFSINVTDDPEALNSTVSTPEKST